MRSLICSLTVSLVVASSALANTAQRVFENADRLFPDLPTLERVERIAGRCGADAQTNPNLAYCTSDNVVLLQPEGLSERQLAYMTAHVYGHAVQVRHGVADVALREIRARRAEEAKLRGWVTRQVECIAGAILAEAGMEELDLMALFETEPMQGSHWGRNPLAKGPRVSIGLKDRAEWLARGQREGIGACAVGEFGSELLIRALR